MIETKSKIFGVVETVYQGRKMNIICSDGKKRCGHIPGGLKTWHKLPSIHDGDVVEIEPWNVEDEKCDIVSKVMKKSIAEKLQEEILDNYLDKFIK